MVQNLYSERELSIKLLLGEKTRKKTNISPFSATHTYIKLTLVSFFFNFFFCTFPLHRFKYVSSQLCLSQRERCTKKKLKKKLTNVSFMYVCVAENGEMLVFFSFLQAFVENRPYSACKKRKNVSFYRGVCMCKGKTNTCWFFFLVFFAPFHKIQIGFSALL